MTITFKPVHLVLIAFVLGLLVTAVILLAAGGGDNGNAQTVVVVTATIDRATLSTSDAAPTSTPVATTTITPTPEPAPQQPVRTCDEIRAAGTYLNDVERDYFLASCQTPASGSNPAPVVSAPSAPAPTTAAPVAAAPAVDPAVAEAERSYRSRAEGIVYAWSARFRQLPSVRTVSAQSAFLDFGAVAGGWANQMDNLRPVPPRYQRAHDQLQGALRALDAQTHMVSQPGFVYTQSWAIKVIDLADAADGAIQDYFLVLGLQPR